MSKGSGRRRFMPTEGILYDPETDMTNIDKRGGQTLESIGHTFKTKSRDPGAPPTQDYWYGNNGRRWAGKGRKADNRNWKNYTKGKQYEHSTSST